MGGLEASQGDTLVFLNAEAGAPTSDLAREDKRKAKVLEYRFSEPSTVETVGDKKGGAIPGRALTLQDIQRDRITAIASSNWSVNTSLGEDTPPFNDELVKDIYKNELEVTSGPKAVQLQRVMMLEITQYLERYLWPNFNAETASFEHVFSILLMVNEKFRENIPAFVGLHSRADVFGSFFKRVLTLKETREFTIYEKVNFVLFMINLFQSLEDNMVRDQVLQLVGLPLWIALSPSRLKKELVTQSSLAGLWQKLQKRDAKAKKSVDTAGTSPFERPQVKLLPSLLDEFLEVLHTVVPEQSFGFTEVSPVAVLYCERFVELLIDLLSQLPTRRFVRTLVSDRGIVIKCRMSGLFRHPSGSLFSQLTDLLRYYEGFEIDDHSGKQLSDEEVQLVHCDKWQLFQRLAFKEQPKLRALALANLASVESADSLLKHLSKLQFDELKQLVCDKLSVVSPLDSWGNREDFLRAVVVKEFEKRRSQRAALNALPLYPNEDVMWDENVVPSINYTGEGCLALPKLNLQFLTLHDYLLRNFNLFRLESTYEIRGDIEEAVPRMHATLGMDEETKFGGWARMAVRVQKFNITEVRQPLLGEAKPAAVNADLQFTVEFFPDHIKAEWDELKEHDVLFLLSVTAKSYVFGHESEKGMSVPEVLGIQHVRGCEVVEIKDEAKVLMNDLTGRIKREEWRPPKGAVRTVTVALDAAQYQLDLEARESGGGDVYQSFNVLLRRKPKENNFKAILESIRDLMNEDAAVPPWLHDIFLGYGDPAAAQWRNMPAGDRLAKVDFKDTFLDAQHVRDCFPSRQLQFVTPEGDDDPDPRPPFKVTLPEDFMVEAPAASTGKRKDTSSLPTEPSRPLSPLVVESYHLPDPGPYPQDQPKQNSVKFTPVQVEAILSGVQPGLTMVVGPPGTGKTDTAVQIMHVLYHNFPGQRILLITHSNQALNQLFEKIMERDIPARYLLRLGMGEKELETDQVFSRQGRVNTMLARRLELLSNVERLAATLDLPTDVAYTCETSAHFWLLRILSRWEHFLAICEASQDNPAIVRDTFPFSRYFQDAPGFKLLGQSYVEDMRVAHGCYRHLKTMFQELEECRAFELLKTTADRSNYLMTKQAKIVAMTCTHAALKRRDFLSLGFKYDSVIIEESAQILEIETFIPMALQQSQDGRTRLKRVVMIGDHHQLPPVVKNLAFQKYSHMDQSLFTRFVRLGIPYTELNAQGRSRPSIASLYNWRYRQLGDLPHVLSQKEYQTANAGFAFTYQMIDVPDYQGHGEREPNPWFYQNLGEAEYVVSCYQYLRLLGYAAEKVSILTTYNGQKHLIRDCIRQRCSNNPLFGEPNKITTVDRFQGSQNDIVLLSLVRTKTVGHLRDVRRLIVAMSRAKLGLYIFCRRALFEQCFELQPTFNILLQRPDKLALVLSEQTVPSSRSEDEQGEVHFVAGLEEMGDIITARYQSAVQRIQAEQAQLEVATAEGSHNTHLPQADLKIDADSERALAMEVDVSLPASTEPELEVTSKEQEGDIEME